MYEPCVITDTFRLWTCGTVWIQNTEQLMVAETDIGHDNVIDKNISNHSYSILSVKCSKDWQCFPYMVYKTKLCICYFVLAFLSLRNYNILTDIKTSGMLALIHIHIQWIVGIIFIILYCSPFRIGAGYHHGEPESLKTIPWWSCCYAPGIGPVLFFFGQDNRKQRIISRAPTSASWNVRRRKLPQDTVPFPPPTSHVTLLKTATSRPCSTEATSRSTRRGRQVSRPVKRLPGTTISISNIYLLRWRNREQG